MSTAGINFTLQVKFCEKPGAEDPEIIVIVGGIIVTETGGGTAWKYVNGINKLANLN